MQLESLAVALCVISLIAAVAMSLVGLAGIADPTTLSRCHDCSRWMMNNRHRQEAVCSRCRHHAHAPIARL